MLIYINVAIVPRCLDCCNYHAFHAFAMLYCYVMQIKLTVVVIVVVVVVADKPRTNECPNYIRLSACFSHLM